MNEQAQNAVNKEKDVEIPAEVNAVVEETNLENCLKVKADPPDISSEDRKKYVKALAGAISHSLRAKGEINVRGFGNGAIGKAAKALAIARSYVKVQNLDLGCSPGFIATKINGTSLTGLNFVTFASPRIPDIKDIDINECKGVLRVQADGKDISVEDRKNNVKKLASAIAYSLTKHKIIAVRCFGNGAIGKAAKALAIARGHIGVTGKDLYCYPEFIVAEMNGSEKTGIGFITFTNES
jgi:stage V sporulation protein SpoVS